MTDATVHDFYDALNKMDKDYSSRSWSGFNIFGDRKSIEEVNILAHVAGNSKALHDRIMSDAKIIEELKKTIATFSNQGGV